MFSLICVWINGWENNRDAGDLRRYCAHYDVIVMKYIILGAWQILVFAVVVDKHIHGEMDLIS